MNVYTPNEEKIVHSTSVDFGKRTILQPVHIVQYDDGLPILAVDLRLNGTQYVIPENAEINIRLSKKDGTFVYNPALGCDAERHTAYFEITQQMTTFKGRVNPIVEVVVGGGVAGSSNIVLEIDRNPIQEGDIESSDEYISVQQYVERAEAAAKNATKSETNAKSSETKAKISETNAKSSETKAKTSETNAKTSETNAKSSETKAKTSEANAKNSETKAKTSETNAANSANAAQAAYEEILGADVGNFASYLANKHAVLQPIYDSSGNLILSSSGENLQGTIKFVDSQEVYGLIERITTLETLLMSIFRDISANKISSISETLNRLEPYANEVPTIMETLSSVEQHAIFDSGY